MKEGSSGGKNSSFMVVLLGIVFDPKKRQILIIKRKKDETIKKLAWSFPGGRAVYGEVLEETLKKEIREKTGYDTESLGSVFSRIAIPEKEDLLLIYYLCEVAGGKGKPGKNILDMKWVSPDNLRKNFTTSFDPALEEYIMNLK